MPLPNPPHPLLPPAFVAVDTPTAPKSALFLGLGMAILGAVGSGCSSAPKRLDGEPPPGWTRLVQRVIERGTPHGTAEEITRTLIVSRPEDPKQSRSVDYLSTIGILMNARDPKTFQPFSVTAIVEDWKPAPPEAIAPPMNHTQPASPRKPTAPAPAAPLPKGPAWVVEQWTAEVSLQSELKRVARSRLIVDSGGVVRTSQPVPAGAPGDPAEQAFWSAVRDRWLARAAR